VSLDSLLQQLNAARWEDRVDAVNRLAALEDWRVPAALVSALYDEDGAVTQAASEAMIASDDLSYVAPLLEALEQTEEHQSDVIWDCVLRSWGKPVADEVYRQWKPIASLCDGEARFEIAKPPQIGRFRLA